MPIEPGDLSGYVLSYFPHLMTPDERQTRQDLLREYKQLVKQLGLEYGHVIIRKSQWSESRQLAKAAYQDARWTEYWERRAAFFHRTRQRILAQHPDDVWLNYCPFCHTLARTPTAKQCGKCFQRWD
jgi:hypothetical protein